MLIRDYHEKQNKPPTSSLLLPTWYAPLLHSGFLAFRPPFWYNGAVKNAARRAGRFPRLFIPEQGEGTP